MNQPSTTNRPTKHPPFVLAKIALEEGLSSGECPVCFASRKATRRYIHSFLYEGMMSSFARQDFLDGRGFCREHFWEARTIEKECWADGFGIAILCENLLETFAKDLEKPGRHRAEGKTSRLRLRKLVRKRESAPLSGNGCLACEVARNTEERHLATLEELLDDKEFCERYERSAGLCINHVQAALKRWTSTTSVNIVKRLAAEHIQQLISELREFQRKHDYQYKHEPRGSEWSSPERAIRFLAGPGGETDGMKGVQPTPEESE